MIEQAPRVDRPQPALYCATPVSLPATQGQRWMDQFARLRETMYSPTVVFMHCPKRGPEGPDPQQHDLLPLSATPAFRASASQ